MPEDTNTTFADLVLYGKIFTSKGYYIAGKNGKYIYVSDKKGANTFIDAGKIKVIDYTGKELVMPSCGNELAHYLSAFAVQTFGTMINIEKIMSEIVPATVKRARETRAKVVYGMGWEYQTFKHNMPSQKQLDALCSDIPMYFADKEKHKALVNTFALVNAGIISADGTPTGLLKEQAGTYVHSFLDNECLFPVDTAKATMTEVQELLLSEGYTMYLDGYSSYFFNDTYYQAAKQLEKSANLHLIFCLSYEINSWINVYRNIKTAVLLRKAICINPLNWIFDDTYALASENLGSIVLNDDTGKPETRDRGADAQIVPERGVIVTNASASPLPEDEAKIFAEFFGEDGRHEEDYTLYYNNIKANVKLSAVSVDSALTQILLQILSARYLTSQTPRSSPLGLSVTVRRQVVGTLYFHQRIVLRSHTEILSGLTLNTGLFLLASG